MRGSRSSRPQYPDRPIRFSHPEASVSPRSADLVGRAVALSPDIPALFDQPLAPHHKMVGRWVASREDGAKTFTRVQARRHIERVFDEAVKDILAGIDFVDLRVVVLSGQDADPPAIVLVCDTVGQLDLGWIEESDAPVGWRAAAYKLLGRMLGRALPVFGYDDLLEEISHYYWEGSTDEAEARQALIDMHGAEEVDFEEMALPSTMDARRPDWMLEENAAPTKRLPAALRCAMRNVREAHKAMDRHVSDHQAWEANLDTVHDYLPGFEECSTLPPMTLVPVEQFAREVDDIGRHGMEYGFMDVVGFCQLSDFNGIDGWLASLHVGARLVAAAQALTRLDPKTMRGSHA